MSFRGVGKYLDETEEEDTSSCFGSAHNQEIDTFETPTKKKKKISSKKKIKNK